MRIVLTILTVLIVSVAIIYAEEKKVNNHPDVSCADCHEVEAPVKKAKNDICFSCHGSYADVAALTKSLEVNPHDSHQGELRCGICHKIHAEPVLYCNECHEFNMKTK